MVEPRYRSRTFRRRRTRTPGGRLVMQYLRRRPANPQCGKCGVNLKGVPRGTVMHVRRVPKSGRRPERPYGGVLCTRCMRAKFKEQAKKI